MSSLVNPWHLHTEENGMGILRDSWPYVECK